MAALADDEAPTPRASPGPSPPTGTGIPPWAGRRGGYTPFEHVGFPPDGQAEEITHEVSVVVAKPRPAVYAAWSDRLNLGEWASLLGQTVLHADDPSLVSYFFFYRWGTLPVLELYTSTVREVREGEAIMERGVDGWPFAAAAFFADGEDGAGTTVVTLRIAYALPSALADAVGAAGIYAHVNDILTADMGAMATFVEQADPVALAAAAASEAAALADRAARLAGMSGEEMLAAAAASPPEGLYDEVMDAEPVEEAGGGGGEGEGGQWNARDAEGGQQPVAVKKRRARKGE